MPTGLFPICIGLLVLWLAAEVKGRLVYRLIAGVAALAAVSLVVWFSAVSPRDWTILWLDAALSQTHRLIANGNGQALSERIDGYVESSEEIEKTSGRYAAMHKMGAAMALFCQLIKAAEDAGASNNQIQDIGTNAPNPDL
jgi:hypothetical protein